MNLKFEAGGYQNLGGNVGINPKAGFEFVYGKYTTTDIRGASASLDVDAGMWGMSVVRSGEIFSDGAYGGFQLSFGKSGLLPGGVNVTRQETFTYPAISF